MFASIDAALDVIRDGGMVIVVDDADRENEGDLVMAADAVTPDAINFMATFGRGLICMPVTGQRLDELEIGPMVPTAAESQETNFTVSIDLDVEGSTGISAHDRARTIAHVLDGNADAEDFRRPGHVFPLRYQPGGVMRRPGHTEAAVDLARLAGHRPAGVICEIMAEDGTMARLPELREFADRHGLLIISIADLIAYRRERERLVRRVAEATLPTPYGDWRAIGYESVVGGLQHVALLHGDPEGARDVLVRMHSECLTGDVFRSQRCDCGAQLDLAMARIAEQGQGVVVYLRGHEGRGIGLMHKLQAYQLQDQGHDTVEANLALGFPADDRDYGTGASILADLGLTTLRLLTNNPAKRAGLEGFGLEIVERVPLQVRSNPANAYYLRTKREKLGHVFTQAPEGEVASTGVGDLAKQVQVIREGLAFAPVTVPERDEEDRP